MDAISGVPKKRQWFFSRFYFYCNVTLQTVSVPPGKVLTNASPKHFYFFLGAAAAKWSGQYAKKQLAGYRPLRGCREIRLNAEC